jgi:hypothetical protein
MKPIVLVACSGQKLDHAAPAKDLYVSDLFKKARAYAEKFGCAWYILSAKHGVVSPDTVIEPYDETLNTKSAAELKDWNVMVRDQVGIKVVGVLSRPIVVLAGAKYRGWLDGVEHGAPMARMGIGQQKAWLKQQVMNLPNAGQAAYEMTSSEVWEDNEAAANMGYRVAVVPPQYRRQAAVREQQEAARQYAKAAAFRDVGVPKSAKIVQGWAEESAKCARALMGPAS